MANDGAVLLEPDERGRVSLGRVPGVKADRYLARSLEDGTVVLEPVIVLPVRAVASFEKALAARNARQRSGASTTPLAEVLGRAQTTPARPARRSGRSS